MLKITQIMRMLILFLVSFCVLGCESTHPSQEEEALQRAESLMREFEGEHAVDFERFIVGERIVYFWQRTIEQAIVEGDFKNYQFDRHTSEFLEKLMHWRDDLPDQLPDNLISQHEAEQIAGGRVTWADLYIISPESPNYPIPPSPTDPCWIVCTVEPGATYERIKVIDAVTGVYLGDGALPPEVSGAPPRNFVCNP